MNLSQVYTVQLNFAVADKNHKNSLVMSCDTVVILEHVM